MLAYLVEKRRSGGEWQVVGWFASFQHAMRSACSLEPARLRVVDLDASEVEAEGQSAVEGFRASRASAARAPAFSAEEPRTVGRPRRSRSPGGRVS